jgi:fused signal recognition particle receptor
LDEASIQQMHNVEFKAGVVSMIFKFLKSSYENVKKAFVKTGSLIGSKLSALFKGKIDEATLEQLEQLLYEADLGVHYAQQLTERVRQQLRKNPAATSDQLIQEIRLALLQDVQADSIDDAAEVKIGQPHVILVVGVNGNGKTTSIAKLAYRYKENGKKVLIGAADTFRAAAVEQLKTWADQIHIDIVKGSPKSDPAAVVHDTLTAAKARQADIVLIDTAGRLHTKTHLMQELEKMRRICRKLDPTAPHETLLVLDATTGQNAIDQANTFNQFTPLTGLILTKLDGTAKGGIVLSIHQQLKLPIRFIGVGEGLEDLQPFQPKEFIDALFESNGS